MTPEMERIGKILVEAEGGHWHDDTKVLGGIFICSQCDGIKSSIDNPNFSKWKNFGRLLKIAKEKLHFPYYYRITDLSNFSFDDDINKIPTLVATELAKILEKK